jgi:hypothetical protein
MRRPSLDFYDNETDHWHEPDTDDQPKRWRDNNPDLEPTFSDSTFGRMCRSSNPADAYQALISSRQ